LAVDCFVFVAATLARSAAAGVAGFGSGVAAAVATGAALSVGATVAVGAGGGGVAAGGAGSGGCAAAALAACPAGLGGASAAIEGPLRIARIVAPPPTASTPTIARPMIVGREDFVSGALVRPRAMESAVVATTLGPSLDRVVGATPVAAMGLTLGTAACAVAAKAVAMKAPGLSLVSGAPRSAECSATAHSPAVTKRCVVSRWTHRANHASKPAVGVTGAAISCARCEGGSIGRVRTSPKSCVSDACPMNDRARGALPIDVAVRLVQGGRDLPEVRHERLGRERTPGIDDLLEVVPLEQLHDEERHLRRLVEAGVEHPHDVLAPDAPRHARLELELLDGVHRVQHVRPQHLDGDAKLRLRLLRDVHRAEAALREKLLDPVTAREDLAGFEEVGHGGRGVRPGEAEAIMGKDLGRCQHVSHVLHVVSCPQHGTSP
jgi:hypothetical protein